MDIDSIGFKNTIVAILFLVLIVVVVLFVIEKQYTLCETEDCFVDCANSCEKAVYKNNVLGVIFYYEIDDSCILTKEVIDVNYEDLTYLKGQEMKCYFTRNSFDERLISDLTLGLFDCSGELKESLVDLQSK